jgi:hypothetical protein
MFLKRLIITIVIILGFASASNAQTHTGGGQSGGVSTGSGAPSGSCSAPQLYVDSSSGDLYDCVGTTWTKVGSAGGGGANTALSNLAAVAINAALLPGTDNSIALGNATHRWTNHFSTALNCGIGGTTSCVITGNGSTSGTATLTWPATAGTTTNPITTSNAFVGPVGAVATPTWGIQTSGGGIAGTYSLATNQVSMSSGGGVAQRWIGTSASLWGAAIVAGWTSGADADSGSTDIAFSRTAAGVLALGNGTSANTTGKFKAAGYMSVGTKFTASGCTNSTTVGGATAGKFSSGTTGTCTVTITMGDTATAPNGWACWAADQTTPADIITQTASNATTATISGTTVTGDVIAFGCVGY